MADQIHWFWNSTSTTKTEDKLAEVARPGLNKENNKVSSGELTRLFVFFMISAMPLTAKSPGHIYRQESGEYFGGFES